MNQTNLLITLFILSVIVSAIAIYKRSKSLKFRLIKHRYSYDQSDYVPQVRIEGIWFNLCYNGGSVLIHAEYFDSFLEPNDAIEQIEKYKSAGNLTIPSNRKLNKNEKQIIVE